MNARTTSPMLGRWRARVLRRATRSDLAAVASLLLLAMAAVVYGRRAATALTPRAYIEVNRMLDELELPIRLPDAPLLGESDERPTLLALIHDRQAAVAFYAPWCGPCQRELPELAAAMANAAQLIVVVSREESMAETRRQLTNIGLADVPFYEDESGSLFQQARVTTLPTTVLVNRSGRVFARGAGYSQVALRSMRRKLTSPGSSALIEAGAGNSP